MTLAATAVQVRYAERTAVHSTSVTLAPNEIVALVGPNGAGKSSLLKALAGLVRHSGAVTWRNAPLAPRERARTLAFLPQTPPMHWPLTAREVVALGRLPHRAFGAAPTAADAAAVERALTATDTAAFAARRVDELSAGERARVLLARALAVEAPVLLADEPIATLDPSHQLAVMAALRNYAAAGRIVVAVLHDLGLAARFCTRVLLMSAGSIVADGAPHAALTGATIRAHYGVEPLLAEHEGEPVIVPWRQLRD